ncbi:branched-chain amino acid ABC transporter permease [Variovorax sp. LARHSF232]
MDSFSSLPATGRRTPQKGSCRPRRIVLTATLVLLALLLPLALPNFLVFQLTMAIVYAIAVLGLNLLTGVSGQFSLGHGGFYAIGAYSAAVLMEHAGLSYGWTLPAAGGICFLAGFLFGFPAVRLGGIYLALATFAFAVAMPQILKLSLIERWTGGVTGISLVKPEAPPGLPLNPDQWLYMLTFLVALLGYVGAHNLLRHRTGRAMLGLRDNATAARAMGVNTTLYKALAFGLSAMYTGISGALGGLVVQYVAPDSFTFALSIALLVGVVVGGVGWLPGAIVGGLFVMFLPNIAEKLSQGLAGAVYGVILILLMYLLPAGFGGLVDSLRRFLMHRKRTT